MTKQELLKTHFGYDTFREGQEAVIDALLAGKDVLAVMPTGAGKSICYQGSGEESEPGRYLSSIPQQLSDAGAVFHSLALCKGRTISDHLCSTGEAYHRGVSGFCAERGYFHDCSG